jgi:hypothetical protein
VTAPAVVIEAPGFSAIAELHDRTISARLTGTADLTIKKALDDFVMKVHDVAQSQNVTEVVVDFQGVEFMNSSCLKGLVAWICTVQDLPTASQYRVVLVPSPSHHWQRRSLHALSCVAADLVTIQS